MIQFKKLKEKDQIKAISNAYKHGGIEWLTFVLNHSPNNMSGWFSFDTSKEGLKYWANIYKKQNDKN